jgi:hypothetical protein
MVEQRDRGDAPRPVVERRPPPQERWPELAEAA